MLKLKIFTFNPLQENTYVLFNDNKECIIIDPGCYYEDEKQSLLSFISDQSLTPVVLLNTHCHLDHVFGNKFVSDTYSLPLYLHKKEEAILEMAPTSGLMFNLPFDNYVGEFIFVKENDSIFLGKDEFKIIETPGHSPGSICLYCHNHSFIIAGDVLFENSIGRTDLPGGDSITLLESIKRIFLLPDEVIIYPGHGNKTTIGKEKKYNPYLTTL